MRPEAHVPSAPRLGRWLRSNALRWIITVVALGFVAWTALSLRAKWTHGASSANPLLLLLAFIAALASTLCVSISWALLIPRFGKVHVPFVHSLAIYARAAIAKYVPGKLAQPVLRLSGLAPYGVTARLLATAMGVETISWCGTGVALALLLGRGQTNIVAGYAGIVIAACCLLVVGLLALMGNGSYPAALRRFLGIEHDRSLLPWAVPLAHLLSWTFWAVHGALLTRAFGPQGVAPLGYSGALFILAPMAGFLALPMPAGVGVRESLLVLGLTPHIGAANALAASLLSRAGSLVADVVCWIVFAHRIRSMASRSERG